MTEAPARSVSPTGVEAATLVRRTAWLVRVVAFVFVGVIVLEGRSDHREAIVAVLCAVGLLLVGWAGIDLANGLGRPVPTWLLTAVLAAMGAATGAVTALPVADGLVAFAVVVAIGAGSELPTGHACVVAVVSILAIEISYLSFGFGDGAVGWPLAALAGVLVGRQRRDARILNAQAVALVAEAQRTREQEHRAATLDERARIAREIHDLLAHSLGALGIQVEAAQALLSDAGDIDRAIPLLDQARRLAASGLEETRRAIEALRTDAPPLPDSLISMADGHAQQYGSAAEVTVTGVPRALTPDANLALIRISQEALANAAKHAPSAAVAIVLDYGLAETTVTVTNGLRSNQQVQFRLDNAQGTNGGYGLAGMRERLLLIGGSLTAGRSETGWTVRAQIPQ